MSFRVLICLSLLLASHEASALDEYIEPPREFVWQFGTSTSTTFITSVCNQPARYCHAFVRYETSGRKATSSGVCRVPIGRKNCPLADECLSLDKTVAFVKSEIETAATSAAVTSGARAVDYRGEFKTLRCEYSRGVAVFSWKDWGGPTVADGTRIPIDYRCEAAQPRCYARIQCMHEATGGEIAVIASCASAAGKCPVDPQTCLAGNDLAVLTSPIQAAVKAAEATTQAPQD